MNRKKLIVRMAALAIAIFIIGSAGRVFEFVYDTTMKRSLNTERTNQITIIAKEYQKYLDETAAKITQLPVNQVVVSQVASDVLKKSPITNLYLWMSNPAGEFIFGAPAPVFERLNKAFDKYRTIIEEDGYYMGRNDFLLKLVHKYENIQFSQYELGTLPRKSKEYRYLIQGSIPDNFRWRFYKERLELYDYSDPLIMELSAPVTDSDRQLLGTLYLKIDDRTVQTKAEYFMESNFLNEILFPGFKVLFVLGLIFMWFLLPSWVYIDARQRDVKNALLWAILTAVTWGFAWIVFLIVRPGSLKSFHCPQCEKELNGTKAYCPHCGFDLSSTFCRQCQYPLNPEWQFCPNCRTDIKEKIQPQERPPEEKTI